MKTKTIAKIASIVLMVSMLLMAISPLVFAEVEGGLQPGEVKGSAQAQTQGIQNIGNQIVTIVSVIGSLASVIVLIVLGIKYMMGSAEEKAEYKKTLMPYVIGAALVFAASTIAGMVYNFANSLNSSAQ